MTDFFLSVGVCAAILACVVGITTRSRRAMIIAFFYFYLCLGLIAVCVPWAVTGEFPLGQTGD